MSNNRKFKKFTKQNSSEKINSKQESVNPVFEEWITEWRNDAIARDLQSKHTYTKCLSSLRKYPLPLKTGKECIILEGFGDKICKLIDEKLKTFLDEGGVLHKQDDENCHVLDSLSETESDLCYVDKNPIEYFNQNLNSNDSNLNDEELIQIESLINSKEPATISKPLLMMKSSKTNLKPKETEDSSDNSEPIKKKSRSNRQKEYIPEFRSGAYALLITLFNNETNASQDSDVCNYMLKEQLMREAQKHSDSSFKNTDGNSHYSAWNSMSTLIKKSLVIKENKLPARYSLTNEGRELATKLVFGVSNTNSESFDDDKDESNNEECYNYQKQTSIKTTTTKTMTMASDDKSKKTTYKSNILETINSNSQIITTKPKPNKHEMFDVRDEDSNENWLIADSPITVQDESSEPDIVCSYEPKKQPTSQKQTTKNDFIQVLSDSDNDITINDYDNDIIAINDGPSSKKKIEESNAKRVVPDLFDDDLPDIEVNSNRNELENFIYEEEENKKRPNENSADSVGNRKTKSKSNEKPFEIEEAPPIESKSKKTTKSSKLLLKEKSMSTGLTQPFNKLLTTETQIKDSNSYPIPSSSQGPSLPSNCVQNNFMHSNSNKTSSYSTSDASQGLSPIFTYRPGTFDVLLFIDNCEQSHAKRQDLLIDEIKKSKIKYDIGKLNVGDFTWIARPKNSSSSNSTNQDIILNCIVERKRMDDFCQSIIDGRYKEQKFRLKKCGITKIVYLIEEFGSIKHMSLPEKSIIQADVNTQMIDNLIVHHTNDPKDSANYLIEMTEYITQVYQNMTLNACHKQDLDDFYKSNTTKFLKFNYFMTFSEFNQFSNKNKPLTIKEMFAKCLLKIQGVSQDKAIAIVDIYSTPDSLIKEYEKCNDDSSRFKLLANIKYGHQRRNIGPALSKVIAQLFYTNGPLP